MTIPDLAKKAEIDFYATDSLTSFCDTFAVQTFSLIMPFDSLNRKCVLQFFLFFLLFFNIINWDG